MFLGFSRIQHLQVVV